MTLVCAVRGGAGESPVDPVATWLASVIVRNSARSERRRSEAMRALAMTARGERRRAAGETEVRRSRVAVAEATRLRGQASALRTESQAIRGESFALRIHHRWPFIEPAMRVVEGGRRDRAAV